MARVVLISSLGKFATARYFIRSFRELKHEVLVCSDLEDPQVDVKITSNTFLDGVLESRNFIPDLVFYIEGGTMELLPRGLQEMSCITAWYGIDTHMAFEKHLHISRLFDISFIAQKQSADRLRCAGIRQAFWLPLAFEPSLVPNVNSEKIYDISYVGSNNPLAHPERSHFLKLLAEHFPSHKWLYHNTPSEMAATYSQSRLVFNKSIKNDFNNRYFEAMGAGAVLITDPVIDNGVELIFKKGVDFYEYHDEESLVEIVRQLLSNPGQLHKTSVSNKAIILGSHTYSHRVASIMSTLSKCQKMKAPSYIDYFGAYFQMALYSLAIKAASKSFLMASQGGSFKKWIAKTAYFLLSFIGHIVFCIEYIFFKIRKLKFLKNA